MIIDLSKYGQVLCVSQSKRKVILSLLKICAGKIQFVAEKFSDIFQDTICGAFLDMSSSWYQKEFMKLQVLNWISQEWVERTNKITSFQIVAEEFNLILEISQIPSDFNLRTYQEKLRKLVREKYPRIFKPGVEFSMHISSRTILLFSFVDWRNKLGHILKGN